MRGLQASIRRSIREERRQLREAAREAKEAARRSEQELAQQIVDRYQAQIAALTTVHRECGPTIEWSRIAVMPDPVRPAAVTKRTQAAKVALDTYRPGLFARMFGGAKKRRAELTETAKQAESEDAHETKGAMEAHVRACNELEDARHLASRVLEGDLDSYAQALEDMDVFDELRDSGGVDVRVQVLRRDAVRLDLVVLEKDVVPDAEESITARGKLSSKKMPKTRGNEIYQDYVCGAALRATREVFAALPVDWVLVTVKTDLLDSSSGHVRQFAVLSLVAPRRTVDRLNFAALDPSDAMAKFKCCMNFKKGAGMLPIEPFTAADLAELETVPAVT